MKPFVGLLEKAAWTFVQVLVAGWLAAGAAGFEGVNVWLLSGVAAAGTVIANGLPESVPVARPLDSVYRVARTFAVAFLAVLVASADAGLSVEVLRAAAFAAVPAVLAAIKAEAAKHVGGDSAATLPTGWDPGL